MPDGPDDFFLPQPELEHLRNSVLGWLDRVQDDYCGQQSIDARTSDKPTNLLHPSRPLKRRASRPPSRSEPLSPPATLADEQHRRPKMADNEGLGRRTPSPTKRRRLGSSADLEATPRGAMAPPEKLLARSQTESRTESSSRASGRSGRSSPTKQLSSLSLQTDGVTTRGLTPGAEGLPQKLAETLETGDPALPDGTWSLNPLANTRHPADRVALQEAVSAEAEHNPAFRPLRPSRFADPDVKERLGPTPSIDDIKAIYSWAVQSAAYDVPESSWNTDVHSPLVKLAVHGGMRHKKQLLDVVNW